VVVVKKDPETVVEKKEPTTPETKVRRRNRNQLFAF
jgi:hypothetical protein